MEDLFRKRPGVTSTRVGDTGGDVLNATYRNYGTHAETIEIVRNPEQISYVRCSSSSSRSTIQPR
jgi:peptide-methionine (S)-S-oxide reductase